MLHSRLFKLAGTENMHTGTSKQMLMIRVGTYHRLHTPSLNKVSFLFELPQTVLLQEKLQLEKKWKKE